MDEDNYNYKIKMSKNALILTAIPISAIWISTIVAGLFIVDWTIFWVLFFVSFGLTFAFLGMYVKMANPELKCNCEKKSK